MRALFVSLLLASPCSAATMDESFGGLQLADLIDSGLIEVQGEAQACSQSAISAQEMVRANTQTGIVGFWWDREWSADGTIYRIFETDDLRLLVRIPWDEATNGNDYGQCQMFVIDMN